VDGLKRLFRTRKLEFHGRLRNLAEPKPFRGFLRQLFRRDWVVYAKRPFGGPEHVLQYLARYTHRVAISNHRLLAFEDGLVTFRWKDYAHGNKHGKMTLSTDEFLRRFLLHILPRGFVRIRRFGFLANRSRAGLIPLCRRLLANAMSEPSPNAESCISHQWLSPVCAGPMIIIDRLTAEELQRLSLNRRAPNDTS
jgi:hypothetical protein